MQTRDINRMVAIQRGRIRTRRCHVTHHAVTRAIERFDFSGVSRKRISELLNAAFILAREAEIGELYELGRTTRTSKVFVNDAAGITFIAEENRPNFFDVITVWPYGK